MYYYDQQELPQQQICLFLDYFSRTLKTSPTEK